MTHENRGRITVDKKGKWRLYQTFLPIGFEAIGTVTRDEFDMGALVLVKKTGLYVQANASSFKSLDQCKVLAALNAT
jgi:hypothetical protein